MANRRKVAKAARERKKYVLSEFPELLDNKRGKWLRAEEVDVVGEKGYWYELSEVDIEYEKVIKARLKDFTKETRESKINGEIMRLLAKQVRSAAIENLKDRGGLEDE